MAKKKTATKPKATARKTKELNAKELAVLRQCAEEGQATLADIATRFRRADDKAQANSWARNSVRRPRRMGLIKKAKRGTYAITEKGRAVLKDGAKTEEKSSAA